MGRYRTFSLNTPNYSSSDYTQKIKNIERLKFARSLNTTSKKTNEFEISCALKAQTIEISNNEIQCCQYDPSVNNLWTWQPACYIAIYENYKTMIELLLAQAKLDKNCYDCTDVPVSLHNGLTSEICYDDYYESIYPWYILLLS